MSFDGSGNNIFNEIPYISLSYSNADSQTSALRLILTLFPDWEQSDGKIEFIRFKDGITNTVCHSRIHPILRGTYSLIIIL